MGTGWEDSDGQGYAARLQLAVKINWLLYSSLQDHERGFIILGVLFVEAFSAGIGVSLIYNPNYPTINHRLANPVNESGEASVVGLIVDDLSEMR
jgi:hypothetical protein